MDKLEIKFVKENETLDININSLFKIVSIEGIDTSESEIYSSSNATYDGMTILSKRLTQRAIGISIDYVGENKKQKRKEIIKFFNLKSKGILIVKYGDIERAIEYHIENFSCPLENIHYALSFTINLICPNPYFTEVVTKKIDIATWLPKFYFPLVIPENIGIIMGLRQPNSIINIINEGDTETGLIIKIRARGEFSNPKIINVNNGEYIKINKTMAEGEEITINTNKGQKKILNYNNGVETNILNLLDFTSTFLTLGVGDNLLSYSADTNPDNMEVSIYYNPCYMGV